MLHVLEIYLKVSHFLARGELTWPASSDVVISVKAWTESSLVA